MKKTNYLLLSLTLLLFLNCSNSDDGVAGGNDPQGTGDDNNPVLIEKYLSAITGSEYDDIKLLYEDDKVVKGFIWNSLQRFQVEYNTSSKVSKVILQGHSSFEGFDFDLSDCTECSHFNYSYENGKISSIKFGIYSFLEYDYVGDRIIKMRDYYYNDPESNNSLRRQYEYQYNTTSKITSIILTEYDPDVRSFFYTYTFDDKVNPFYVLWKETGLHFPSDTSGIYRNNLVFYPNNVLRVEREGQIKFDMTMNYDTDGYPIFYNIHVSVGEPDDESGSISYNE